MKSFIEGVDFSLLRAWGCLGQQKPTKLRREGLRIQGTGTRGQIGNDLQTEVPRLAVQESGLGKEASLSG